MSGRGHVEGRVAGVHVVTYRDQEVGPRILAARSDLQSTSGQARMLLEHPPDIGLVTGGDGSEEPQQRTPIELVGSPTCLAHRHRMPDPRSLRGREDKPPVATSHNTRPNPRADLRR